MVNAKRLGTAAVYGIVDIVAESADEEWVKTNPNIAKPFQNATDLSRAAAFLFGIGAPMVAKGKGLGPYADTLQAASLPLLEKSVYNAVRGSMTVGRSARTANRLVLRQPGVATQQIRVGVPENVF